MLSSIPPSALAWPVQPSERNTSAPETLAGPNPLRTSSTDRYHPESSMGRFTTIRSSAEEDGRVHGSLVPDDQIRALSGGAYFGALASARMTPARDGWSTLVEAQKP